MNLRYRKINLVLNGNEMSGNTFEVRDFIKGKLSGKWVAERKVWLVDVDAVNYWIEQHAITVDDAPTVPTATVHNSQRDGFKVRNGGNGWCDKCHSYCYGDCQS